MAGIVAALDADVLVPILSCDFLLTAFDLGIYEPVVGADVLREVQHALGEDFPELEPSAIAYRINSMRDVLADHIVQAANAVPDGINVKDQHVVAAASAGEAAVLVSNDRRLRTEVEMHVPGLMPVTLDRFALMLWDLDPDATSATIDALARKRMRPPITRQGLIQRLAPVLPSLHEMLARTQHG